MTSTLEAGRVARIAAEAARLHGGFELMGVTVAGGSDYAEILMRELEDANDSSLMTLGVFRDQSEADLRDAIEAQLLERA